MLEGHRHLEKEYIIVQKTIFINVLVENNDTLIDITGKYGACFLSKINGEYNTLQNKEEVLYLVKLHWRYVDQFFRNHFIISMN